MDYFGSCFNNSAQSGDKKNYNFKNIILHLDPPPPLLPDQTDR